MSPSANNLDIGALLADFLTEPTEREASAHLEHIRFSGGELILEDQTRGRTLARARRRAERRFPRRSALPPI